MADVVKDHKIPEISEIREYYIPKNFAVKISGIFLFFLNYEFFLYQDIFQRAEGCGYLLQ